MPEELHNDSMSDRAAADPATVAAYHESGALEDREVYDVNGELVGKVTRCFAEGGSLVRCDVTLSENAKGIFGVEREVTGLPPQWIANVDNKGIHLDRAGEQLLRPEDPRPLNASEDRRGSDHLPRKQR